MILLLLLRDAADSYPFDEIVGSSLNSAAAAVVVDGWNNLNLIDDYGANQDDSSD
jgi:hypothetical protein